MNLNPSTQTDLFEYNEIFNQLSKLYKKNNLPNKILLSGEKGIGKSTLLRTLAGLRPATKGSIAIDGKDLNELQRRRRAQLIGILFVVPAPNNKIVTLLLLAVFTLTNPIFLLTKTVLVENCYLMRA